MDDNVPTLDEQLAEAYERGRKSVLDHVNMYEARKLLSSSNHRYLIVGGGRSAYNSRLLTGAMAALSLSAHDLKQASNSLAALSDQYSEELRFHNVKTVDFLMPARHPSGIIPSRRGKNLKLSEARSARYTKSQKR